MNSNQRRRAGTRRWAKAVTSKSGQRRFDKGGYPQRPEVRLEIGWDLSRCLSDPARHSAPPRAPPGRPLAGILQFVDAYQDASRAFNAAIWKPAYAGVALSANLSGMRQVWGRGLAETRKNQGGKNLMLPGGPRHLFANVRPTPASNDRTLASQTSASPRALIDASRKFEISDTQAH